jgi:hypothetical protein
MNLARKGITVLCGINNKINKEVTVSALINQLTETSSSPFDELWIETDKPFIN